MSSVTKTRKPVQPVRGVCRWVILPIPVRDFESGVLAINGTEYVVTLPADRSGARLTKPGGEQYHVDLDGRRCDCPDAVYRPREGGCKHFKAVAAAVGRLPAARLLLGTARDRRHNPECFGPAAEDDGHGHDAADAL